MNNKPNKYGNFEPLPAEHGAAFDPTIPPPFPIGASHGQKPNGADLTERQWQALDLTLADHLVVKGELEAARQEIAALRGQLTQAAIENESLRSFNNLLESRVNAAVAERDGAVVERARYESRIAMIAAALREPLGVDHEQTEG